MIIGRRKFLTGLFGLVAAPAVIRVADLMPVKSIDQSVLDQLTLEDYYKRILEPKIKQMSDAITNDIIYGNYYDNSFAKDGAKIGTNLYIRLPEFYRV